MIKSGLVLAEITKNWLLFDTSLLEPLLNLVVGLLVHLLVEFVTARIILMEVAWRASFSSSITVAALVNEAFNAGGGLLEFLGAEVWIVLDDIESDPQLLISGFQQRIEVNCLIL